jgi:hypothetical protein
MLSQWNVVDILDTDRNAFGVCTARLLYTVPFKYSQT